MSDPPKATEATQPNVAPLGDEARTDNDHETQPTVEAPTGDGWMPLCKAALWIATEGGTVAATSGDQERWEAAFRKLTNALSFGKLRCTGERNGRGEDIPTGNWAHCRVDFMGAAWVDDNFRDGLYLADKFHLRTYAVVDVDAWPNKVGDKLANRYDGWTSLMVPKSEVAVLFPGAISFSKPRGKGRPSDKEMIVKEYEQLCALEKATYIDSRNSVMVRQSLETKFTGQHIPEIETIRARIGRYRRELGDSKRQKNKGKRR